MSELRRRDSAETKWTQMPTCFNHRNMNNFADYMTFLSLEGWWLFPGRSSGSSVQWSQLCSALSWGWAMTSSGCHFMPSSAALPVLPWVLSHHSWSLLSSKSPCPCVSNSISLSYSPFVSPRHSSSSVSSWVFDNVIFFIPGIKSYLTWVRAFNYNLNFTLPSCNVLLYYWVTMAFHSCRYMSCFVTFYITFFIQSWIEYWRSNLLESCYDRLVWFEDSVSFCTFNILIICFPY